MLHQVDLILWLHLILCKCCVQTNLTAYLPSTPLTSSWSQSHTSTSGYPKHCRDRDDVSGVFRCDTKGWYEIGRFRNFKEQEIPILTGKWGTRFHSPTAPGQQTYTCLFTAVRKTHSFSTCIALGCLYYSVPKQVISLTHVIVEAKNYQHNPPPKNYLPRRELCLPAITWEKKILWQKHNFDFFLSLRKGTSPLIPHMM